MRVRVIGRAEERALNWMKFKFVHHSIATITYSNQNGMHLREFHWVNEFAIFVQFFDCLSSLRHCMMMGSILAYIHDSDRSESGLNWVMPLRQNTCFPWFSIEFNHSAVNFNIKCNFKLFYFFFILNYFTMSMDKRETNEEKKY